MFAVDAGSTQGLAQTIQKQGLKDKGWVGGGYDLTPITEQLLAAGYIQFTIDQQPYLQGFLPILELYLYKASQGLTGTADVDTGLKFLDKTTVVPYSSTKSRLRGHEQLARRPEERSSMTSLASDGRPPQTPPPRSVPGTDRRRGGPATRGWGCSTRFLTLREGSIIVVTVDHDRLLQRHDLALPHRRQLQDAAAVLLLPRRSWPPARCS